MSTDYTILSARVTKLEQEMIANLRDFFATSALTILANSNVKFSTTDEVATAAYAIADSMMEKRNAN